MKNMKQKILITSLCCAGLATLSAVVNTHGLTAQNAHGTLKLFTYSGYLGLFSISSFFVGLAYPKDVE